MDRGRVRVGGAPTANPARLVGSGESVAVAGPPPRYVSRGGDKLAAALDRFAVEVVGLRVLDAGASTGGFTDCVLQAGAAEVVAVDSGRGQLHRRIEIDPRVDSRERTNLRTVDLTTLGEPFDLVVADLSFISLKAVATVLVSAARRDGHLVCLVKPQFEATRDEVDAGRGVITDPEIWHRTLTEVTATMEGCGAAIMGAMPSPLRGADGNVEFLVHLIAGRPAERDAAPYLAAAVAVAEADAGTEPR